MGVCTATFGQYKLFENHVYSAHSGGRKVPQNKPMGAAANRQPQKAIPGRPFKVSDEITIIPQGKNTQANKPKPVVPVPVPKKKPPTEDADIIELDDEEEEIDDVEGDGGEKKRNGNNQSPRKKMTNLPKLQVQILLPKKVVKKVWKRYETMMRPKKKMMIENPVDYFLQIHSVLESRRKTSLYFVVFFLQNSQNNLFDN